MPAIMRLTELPGGTAGRRAFVQHFDRSTGTVPSLMSHGRYVVILASLLALLSIALAIDPHDRSDWALENVLVIVLFAGLAATYRRFPLSRISYTLIFLFLCLHVVGAHYTYSLVPYDAWWTRLTGHSLNAALGWERNNFDRVVHFCYGLLLAYPVREVFLRIASVKGFWGYFLPLDLTMSTSVLYELIEWGAAVVFGGELGAAFLGTQGDPWDAQKDMALAGLGALIAMLVTAALNVWLQRDFAREWSESLRVKDRRPYGEEEIQRLLAESRGGQASG
jgi:putative membrane protein